MLGRKVRDLGCKIRELRVHQLGRTARGPQVPVWNRPELAAELKLILLPSITDDCYDMIDG